MNPVTHLFARASQAPDAVLLEVGDSRVTNAEALTFVRQAATYLRGLGVRPGDTVALNLPIPLHILLMLATWHEAAVSLAYTPSTSNQIDFKPSVILSTNSYPDSAAAQVIRFDESVLAAIESAAVATAPVEYATDDSPCRVLYSSGTTGTPKGVAFTPAMMERRAARSMANWLSRRPFMSLFDIGALGGFMAFYGQLVSGDTYLVPGQSIHNATQVFRNKVAYVQGSPQQISGLLNRIERDNYTITSVQEVAVAGSVISSVLTERIHRVLGAKVLNIYGSTEAGALTYRQSDSDDPFDMGVIFEDVEIQAVAPDGSPVPEGEVGDLRCKCAAMAGAYFHDPEATERFFRDGWYYPGDSGRILPGRRLILEGRVSELVNLGGVKVDPARTDEFALSLTGVLDAGAFGFPGPDGLDRLGLAIVADHEFDVDALNEKMQRHFGNAAPSELRVVESIPRNERGKVQRSLLAERMTQLPD